MPGSPVLLAIPAHDVDGAPAISGVILLPGMLPNQGLWVLSAWVDVAVQALSSPAPRGGLLADP